MKYIITILIIVFNFSCALVAQGSWNLLTTQEDVSITDAITFSKIHFIDGNNGWACGSKGMTGAIFKTEDGGSTWAEVLITGIFDSFSDMCFLEDGTIWAGGSKNTSKKCLLYKSIDNGTNWIPYTLPEDLSVNCLYFADNNEGWAILNESGASRIYHTADGGENWTVQMNGTTSDGWTIRELFCWYFFDKNNAIAAGNYGYIIYTTDGGSTWNYRDTPISTQLWNIYFVDDTNGWIVGGAGNLLYTTDKGVTWNELSLGITQNLKSVHFIDQNNGWVAGGVSNTNQGIIYSSNDGGLTWSQETLSSNRDLNDIFFLDNNSAWAAGNYCTVYHYGTTTTSAEELTALPDEFELNQNYPNPFNPTTTISFTIPTPPNPSPYQGERAREGLFVSLKIYDILGNEVATLVDEQKSPGYYEVEFDASCLSSGVYLCALKHSENYKVMKMLLLR
ncbi:MAG: YCF48-related protein [Ignavibacteria bacterium]